MSSKRSSGVSEAATMVDAKRKGNLVVMTKGGTKKSNTYYFALGETALYYFTNDSVCVRYCVLPSNIAGGQTKGWI